MCMCVMEQKLKMQKFEKENNSTQIVPNFVPLEIIYIARRKKKCVYEQKIKMQKLE